jgi:2-keto-4-pentenoate hydratase/2-oxohepta-3-ene-1,7-dioic acid hydratase in catechol pathway
MYHLWMPFVRFQFDGRVGHGVLRGETIDELVAVDTRAGIAVRSVEATGESFALDEVRLLSPVPEPQKFLGVWLNYRDHVEELIAKGIATATPESPVFFSKMSSCVVGPGDPIVVPTVSTLVDYEAELAVVIGARCRNVSANDAMGVVAGFTVCNDVSVRDWQLRAPTMLLGKSFDTHGPLGPVLVTPEELGPVRGRRVRTWLNGELLQDGTTDDLIFGVGELIELLSTVCTLEPGDVIATGTPGGIGALRKPARWLTPGDVVVTEVEGVGRLENPVVAQAKEIG